MSHELLEIAHSSMSMTQWMANMCYVCAFLFLPISRTATGKRGECGPWGGGYK